MSYLIGTGWWCTDNDERTEQFLNGDEYIRSKSFQKLWESSIKYNSSPEEVIVIDSASPIKADWNINHLPYKVLTLPKNLGHATNLNSDRFCGWTASVLLSMEYASFTDVDFYIYVEQDVLINGEQLISKCIEFMGDDKNFLFGKTDNYISPLQQSFFIIRKTAINNFSSNLRNIRYDDAQMSPEMKFAIATSRYFRFIPKFLFVQRNSLLGKIWRRVSVVLANLIASYHYLPVEYGRNRPIDFAQKEYYFQHASAEELKQYLSDNPNFLNKSNNE